MASATEHRPVLNGGANGHLAGGAPKQVATRIADDDDSVGGGTEQFPAFDPLHDGSEEDVAAGDDNEYYTHSFGVAGVNGDDGPRQEQSSPHADNNNNDNEDDLSTPLSTVDPILGSEHRSSHDEDDDDDDDDDATTATSAVTSPSIISPPYWQHGHGATGPSHGNGALLHPHYNHSAESLVPGAITLQDNEADEEDEPAERRRVSEETRTSYGRDRNRACWAKSVEVTDYVVVNGSATNIGAFVVWNIRVETLSGPYMNIRKRYSEFDDFRRQLIRTFPNFEAAVPALPRKSVISKFRPRFLEQRRAGLQYFLNCILLNPEFSGSPVLKDFLFS